MRKKYARFRAVSGGIIEDRRWAFEVATGRVITYEVTYTRSWFFKEEAHYKLAGADPITAETTVELWRPVPPGSGMCEVKTGNERYDFHVYGEAEAFVADVEREVRAARAATS